MDAWDAAAPPAPQAASAPPQDAWDAAAPVAAPTPASKSASSDFVGGLRQGATDLAAGLVRGAGSIGATLLSPLDAAARAVNGGQPISVGGYDILGQDRRAGMDAGLTSLGADPSSFNFKAGKLGGEIAGTAGAGPALGVAAKAAGAAPEAVAALTSGGLSLKGASSGSALGDTFLRALGGGAAGGASAGMVDPNNATTGAGIGALTPGAAWLAGMTGGKIGDAVGGVLRNVLGATTGTGADAVSAAFKSGLAGDQTFLNSMRGNTNISDIVGQAKDALDVMRGLRGQEYRAGMAGISGDKTVLDMTPIQQAVQDAQAKFGSFNGQVVNRNAAAAIQDVSGIVDNWAKQDPAIFHTPEGLDKLKQAIGGELENAKPGTQTDAALKGIYNTVKSTISTQAPKYADVMSAYQDASEQLSDISRTLSLNPRASIDTAVRKLQSVLRNNVNTNFGNRASAVDALQTQGGANIVPALAGQSMNTWWPRGVAGAVDAAAAIPAAIHNPMLLASGVAASPRLVGEAAYTAGRIAAPLRSLASQARSLPAGSAIPLLGASQTISLPGLIGNQAAQQPVEK